MIGRREFVAGLGSAAAWPAVAGAQQRTIPVVGVLGRTTGESFARPLAVFMQGLKEAGFIESQNLRVEHAGRTMSMIGCPKWRPISCAPRCRLSRQSATICLPAPPRLQLLQSPSFSQWVSTP
jgi:hypothetical protein